MGVAGPAMGAFIGSPIARISRGSSPWPVRDTQGGTGSQDCRAGATPPNPSVLCLTDSFGREHAWWVAIAARGADTFRSTRAERIMNKLTTWVTVTASPNTLAGLMKGGSGDY